MFPFRSSADVLGRKTKKKTATAYPIAARDKPIWFARGKVNRVRRIGAFSWGKPKKLPWVRVIAAELTFCLPANSETRSRLGYPEKAKPDGVLPSFAPYLIRRGLSGGQKRRRVRIWTSHPLKWSWHLNALPRSGEPSARRIVGEVSEHGRRRPGAGHEARETLVLPVKRKAESCPRSATSRTPS